MVNEKLTDAYDKYVADVSQIINFTGDIGYNPEEPAYSVLYVKELLDFAIECYEQLSINDGFINTLKKSLEEKTLSESKWADMAVTAKRSNYELLLKIADLSDELSARNNAVVNAQQIIRDRNRVLASIRSQHSDELAKLKQAYELKLADSKDRYVKASTGDDKKVNVTICVSVDGKEVQKIDSVCDASAVKRLTGTLDT